MNHVRASAGGLFWFAITNKAHAATASGIRYTVRDRPANQPVVATGNRLDASKKVTATNDNNPKRRSNHSEATVPITAPSAWATTSQFVDPLLIKNGAPSKRPATRSAIHILRSRSLRRTTNSSRANAPFRPHSLLLSQNPIACPTLPISELE